MLITDYSPKGDLMKGDKPDYAVRVKMGERWETIGAAWNSKNDTISVKLNTIPVANWDGSVLLVKPKEE